MKSLFLSALLLGTFISFSTQASPEFRVYGRLFNPNHCTYFSQIEGEFVLETVQENGLGPMKAELSLQQSFGPAASGSWIPLETPLNFTSSPTPANKTLYSGKLTSIVNSRGSYAYEALRFKVQIQGVLYPENPELYYSVKFANLLHIGCDPENDPFSELAVTIECQGLAPSCETQARD